MVQEKPPQAASWSADRAYAEVRARLRDGRYAEGKLLHEDAVAAELSLPDAAVHEAFDRLRTEGALRLYPTWGAHVVEVSAEEARDVMEARLLLEVFALDSIAARGRPALRELGLEMLSVLHEVSTSDEAVALGRDFHTRLVRAVGNPVVTDIHATLWDRTTHVVAASMAGPSHPEYSGTEHQDIAEAMARGRGGETRELLHRHVAATLRRIGVAEEFALPRPAGS